MAASSTCSTKTSSNGITYTICGPQSQRFGVVFIHDWGCVRTDWNGVLSELSKTMPSTDLIAPDLPGHGQTPSSLCEVPSISGFAELVLAFCRELNLHHVVLVGHSLGVRIVSSAWSQVFKSEVPGPKIIGLVFLDGSYYKLRPSLFAFDKQDPRSASLTEEEILQKKAEAFQQMFSAKTPDDFRAATVARVKAMDKRYSEDLRDYMIKFDGEGMANVMQRLGTDRTKLLNIQSSDHAGDGQRIAMQEGQRSKWMVFLDETVPQVKQTVVTDSAHFAHVDRPDFVAKQIEEFVKEVANDRT